jgi:adenylate cyclase
LSGAETKRRLATILAADAAGLDERREAGEGEARRLLDAAMQALGQRVAAHDGAVLRSAGGALVAAFDSPVEAVRCALAAQRAMAEDDAEPGAGLRFRLGIAPGADADQAQRLERQAEPGGICLAAAVRELVHGKIDFDAEGAAIAPQGGDWRIAPPLPGHVPAIPIPARQAAPAGGRDADRRRFPALRLSLAAAGLAAAAVLYLAVLRPVPLPDEPQPAAPTAPAVPARTGGPTLPGRPFVPEQMPFVDDADRARLRAEYLAAAPYKALALSRGNGSAWYVQGAPSPALAGEAALDSCRRNAPEPCELFAQGDELAWERPLPPVPPQPWLPPEAERVAAPFDAARVPLAGPAMRQLMQVEYAPRRGPKALALARSGTVGIATQRASDADALRAALEQCGDLTGTACAIVALGDAFVVPVPETVRATGLFLPAPLRPFGEAEYRRLAEQYLPHGGWKAVALGRDGRMGLSAGRGSEQEAAEAALQDCRAAKPPSTGPGGVAAAVLGNLPPDCAVYALGIFTVETK